MCLSVMCVGRVKKEGCRCRTGTRFFLVSGHFKLTRKFDGVESVHVPFEAFLVDSFLFFEDFQAGVQVAFRGGCFVAAIVEGYFAFFGHLADAGDVVKNLDAVGESADVNLFFAFQGSFELVEVVL